MKVNVSVDLSEFYSEEEGDSFSEQIKDSIAYDVKQKVLKDWSAKITDSFTDHVRQMIRAEKDSHIEKCISETIATAKVKSIHGDDLTIDEYIKADFNRMFSTETQIKRGLDSIAESSAKAMAGELKNRYDLMFASSLVSKMNELGMLKPDVAKLILGE